MTPKINTKIEIKVEGNSVLTTSNIFTNKGINSLVNGGLSTYISLGTGAYEESPFVEHLATPKSRVSGRWKIIQRNSIDVEANTITTIEMLRVSFPVEKDNVTYSEIGISDSSGELRTYALLKDSLGDVSTVTVLKGERVEVEYTIEVVFPYRSTIDDNDIFLLGIPRLYNVPGNMNGGHYVYVYEGDNDALEIGNAPSGLTRVNDATFRKVAEKLIVHVPPFVNRPNYGTNGIYVSTDNSSYDNRYTYCVAFSTPKKLPEHLAYTSTVSLPYFTAKSEN